jgi:hypothetical protein
VIIDIFYTDKRQGRMIGMKSDEIKQVVLELKGLKKLQKQVGLNVVECMERIFKIERYLGMNKSSFSKGEAAKPRGIEIKH